MALTKGNTTPGWLTTGREANDMLQREQSRVTSIRPTALRYWMTPGETGKITFLDGSLDEDGMFDIPMYFEHNVKMAGNRWDQFVCTQYVDPCPICEGGDTPRFVGVVTVIDHRKIESKKDVGKVYQNDPKLFVMTTNTLKTLMSYAKKRGGLTGWTVEVSRTGDKKPRVGDTFDFETQVTEKELLTTYGVNGKLPIPDYSKSLNYLPAAELRKLGFGAVEETVSYGPGEAQDLEDDLA